MVYWIN